MPTPAYSPHNLPTYTLSNRAADRGNYAFAIMQHNLIFNNDNSQSISSTPTPTPSPDSEPDPDTPTPASPGSRPPNPNPNTPRTRTSRAQRAALRDFHATQNPELWGRRVGHGRQARLIADENRGFWAWLGDLLVDEDRGRVLVLSAGPPWGLMGPPGLT
jgi:hypothetical protein